MAAPIADNTLAVVLTGFGVALLGEVGRYLREGREHRWAKDRADELAQAVRDQAAVVKQDLNQQTAELVAGSKERNKAIVAAVDRGVADASAAIDKSNHLTEKGHAILEQGNAVLEQVVALRKDMEQKVDKP